jgi:hypothetical protein
MSLCLLYIEQDLYLDKADVLSFIKWNRKINSSATSNNIHTQTCSMYGSPELSK